MKVPLKVAKASQELSLGTIPGGSNSDYKAISVQLQLLTGTELGNKQNIQTGTELCQVLGKLERLGIKDFVWFDRFGLVGSVW